MSWYVAHHGLFLPKCNRHSSSILARLIPLLQDDCRNDSSFAVRTASVHVWKNVVVNTPRTLRTIMPRLLDVSIEAIASRGEERQCMASRCLGELVRKMGGQVRLHACLRACVVYGHLIAVWGPGMQDLV
jgi:hypothetical protein